MKRAEKKLLQYSPDSWGKGEEDLKRSPGGRGSAFTRERRESISFEKGEGAREGCAWGGM